LQPEVDETQNYDEEVALEDLLHACVVRRRSHHGHGRRAGFDVPHQEIPEKEEIHRYAHAHEPSPGGHWMGCPEIEFDKRDQPPFKYMLPQQLNWII
jgi:hypothetical protein